MNQLIELTQTTSTMSSREIAELTGKQHKDVLYDIRKMFGDLGATSAEFSADLLDSYGRTQPGFSLPKRECLILVSGYSVILRAKIIDRWEALESGKALPQASAPAPAVPASVEAVMFAEAVNRALRLEGSAALGMLRSAVALKAPEMVALLPVYSIDAPTSAKGSGSSEATQSLTDTLKEYGVKLSTVKANKRLQELGLLEQLSRPSSKGDEIRMFWSLTEKGLEFGKNLTHPQNQKETQVHFFRSKGSDLVDLLAV